jgi:hypothetical protein
MVRAAGFEPAMLVRASVLETAASTSSATPANGNEGSTRKSCSPFCVCGGPRIYVMNPSNDRSALNCNWIIVTQPRGCFFPGRRRALDALFPVRKQAGMRLFPAGNADFIEDSVNRLPDVVCPVMFSLHRFKPLAQAMPSHCPSVAQVKWSVFIAHGYDWPEASFTDHPVDISLPHSEMLIAVLAKHRFCTGAPAGSRVLGDVERGRLKWCWEIVRTILSESPFE